MFDIIKVQQDTIKQLHKQFTGAAETRASYAIDHNGDILLTPDGMRAYRIIRPLFFLDLTALKRSDVLVRHFSAAPGNTEVSPTYKTLKDGRGRTYLEFEFDNGTKVYFPKTDIGNIRPDENITYYMDNRHAPLRVYRANECIAVIMPKNPR
jgi:hypothetical protein